MEVISRKEAIEKGLKMYFTGKPCKYGHVAERRVDGGCLECGRGRNKAYREQNREYFKEYREQNKEYLKEYREQNKEYFKEYGERNKEHIKEYKKEYYEQNKEYIKEYKKEHYEQNKEHFKERNKEYYEQNKEYFKERNKEYYGQNREYFKKYREQNREQYNERRRDSYASDGNFKTSIICRSMLRRTLNATSSTKDSRTYELLGYCNEQLKTSIESKFLEGMSWDNYGVWHIDHIYPVMRYIKDGVEDPSIINALDNLIPMWAEHNKEKSERTLEEYLDDRRDLVELYGRFL